MKITSGNNLDVINSVNNLENELEGNVHAHNSKRSSVYSISSVGDRKDLE
jgi:hypothetical protein